MKRLAKAIACLSVAGLAGTAQSQVVREEIEGITNFARIETTVACAGAISPESVAGIKEMGFGAIINLRRASEEGANIEDEAAAAEAAGIRFIHLPFGGEELDMTVPDRFLAAMAEPGVQPAFIHCAGGGRAAMMWFIKRVVVDEWDVDTAMEEATALGLRPESRLREVALEYLASRSG